MEPIHVLGGGSMGLLFAASMRIAFPSFPVKLLLRPHHESRIHVDHRRRWIDVCLTHGGRPRMVPVPAETISTRNKVTSIRHLLLTTKAQDAVPALKGILDSIDETRIIILCNGAMAVQEEIQEALLAEGKESVSITLASTTHGAYREDSNDDLYHVTHAGIGKTFVEDDADLAQLWDQSGLFATTVASSEMKTILWQKLAANCTINPLTAILDCPNGQLPGEPLFQQMATPILQEIDAVASNERLGFEKLKSSVDQVIAETLDNKSSMHQDIHHGRPTEIDYLNGYVVKKGNELGIDTPVNMEITERIKQLGS